MLAFLLLRDMFATISENAMEITATIAPAIMTSVSVIPC